MPLIKYKDGTYIGPYNILLKYRTIKKGSRWYGIFVCPECGKEFETAIDYIVKGQTRSCGCVGGKKDLTGQRFGKLIALYPTDKREFNHVVWHCKCDCGKEKDVSTNHLIDGNCRSCGCLFKEDLIGQRFGKLTVIDENLNKIFLNNREKEWICKCDCGGTKITSTSILKRGDAKSCGCLLSYGEYLIEKILDKKEYKYFKQYVFKDCVNPKTNRNLRFDFFLPNYNLCIEYNGSQHYIEEIERWSHNGYMTVERVKEIQYRDSIKQLYCNNNNIILLIIPFWEQNNIETIIDKNISELEERRK